MLKVNKFLWPVNNIFELFFLLFLGCFSLKTIYSLFFITSLLISLFKIKSRVNFIFLSAFILFFSLLIDILEQYLNKTTTHFSFMPFLCLYFISKCESPLDYLQTKYFVTKKLFALVPGKIFFALIVVLVLLLN